MIVNEGNKGKAAEAAPAVVASPAADEIKSVVVPVLPAGTEPSASDLKALLELLVRREVRISAKEEAENNRIEARQVQRKKSGEGSQVNTMLKQANCLHKKGGKLQGAQIDHCVAMHLFVDGSRRISCHRCGMRWHQNDTRTTLYVDHGGEIVARPNHTGRSWKDAVLMAAQSTNSQTSSEIPLSMGANPIALMSDKEAAEVLRDRNTAEDSPAPLTPRI